VRILATGRYPREAGKVRGGVEAVAGTLTPAIAAHPDVEHVTYVVFVPTAAAAGVEKVSSKLTIIRIVGIQKFQLIIGALIDGKKLRAIARQSSADLIHAHGLGLDSERALHAGLPSVVTIHGLFEVEARRRLSSSVADRLRLKMVDRLVDHALRDANAIISISSFDQGHYRDRVRGRLACIPNPIAPEFFDAYVDDYPAGSILYAGWLEPRKNVVGMIRAYARLRARGVNVPLLLAGPSKTPEYEATVRQAITDLQLTKSVQLLGHQTWPGLITLMQRAAVVTLFSHLENLPTVLAQAMAMGRPVVATNVAGIPEMVTDGENGYLVDDGDEEVLADRWHELLHSEELRRRLGWAGREKAIATYSADVVANRTVEVYRTACEHA
jgi:glycosyltransferase involved in cell wall biosynthesis